MLKGPLCLVPSCTDVYCMLLLPPVQSATVDELEDAFYDKFTLKLKNVQVLIGRGEGIHSAIPFLPLPPYPPNSHLPFPSLTHPHTQPHAPSEAERVTVCVCALQLMLCLL